MFGRRRREVARHVKGYREGRRLMRLGDGADEWIGMDIAREHLLALIALGCDEHGARANRARRVVVLRTHGLHKHADALERGD